MKKYDSRLLHFYLVHLSYLNVQKRNLNRTTVFYRLVALSTGFCVGSVGLVSLVL